MITGKETTVVLACYFLGCFTSGYYWVRLRTGLDIRAQGSGNVGARNVGRALGAPGFMVTFILDLLKGVLAVRMALFFGLNEDAVIAAMVAVVVGHTWPAQLRFRGGKGISTSLGALLAYDTFIVFILLVMFLPVWALLRSFTFSGLVAFALSPLLLFLCGLGNPAVAAISFLAIIILVAHRKNIREEMAGRLAGGPAVKEASLHSDKETRP